MVKFMKRKILLTLGLLFSVVTLLGVLAACRDDNEPEKQQSGSEAGTYYCDYEGVENDLTLGGMCEFELKIGTTVMKGDYALEGEALTLSPENAGAISATYRNERISFTYSNVSYTFLRKIEYTVTFDTDGGTEIDAVTVVNGRTVARPTTDPEKGELVFVGWYTDAGFKNPFYFSQPITENKTLYARFVAMADPEFKVSFDLGYTGAQNPADIQTVGHKVFLTDEPPVHPEGKVFLGWYVSDFESRTKLTYEYTDEIEITQDLTLFAVWDDGAPEVSVSTEGVKIGAEGMNASYELRITDPDNNVSTASGALSTGAATLYSDYNFATKDAGEYKIEVDVNNKTTTRYFNNKALARVSVFKVDDTTNMILLFNKVENATSYAISYECGTPDHHHVDTPIPNDTGASKYISYDFSACDMCAEGITFTVKALADGHVASVSKGFKYINILDQVDDEEIELDKTTGTLTWSAVEHATRYRVSVALDGEPVATNEEVTETSYSIKRFGKGELTVSIVPVAFGWNSPEATDYTFTKATLAAPQNVRLNGIQLAWNAVEGATGYKVKIGNATRTVTGATTTTYVLTDEDLGSDSSTQITVYAVNGVDAEESYASDVLTVTNTGAVTGLAYSAGKATWDAVFGATGYQWKIGENGTVQTVTDHEAEITFTAGGTQTIYVRAMKDDNGFAWVHIDVTVYMIDFEINTAEIDGVPAMYLAEGDPIALPQPEWIGYDFQGWYRGGYNGEGQKYDNTTFDGGALTLYAYFTPQEFTITLVAGNEGDFENPEDAEYKVQYRAYGEGYKLPIPAPTSVEYTFTGWYSGVNGTGSQFADANGNPATPFTLLQNVTLYAAWTTPFTYKETRVDTQDGYAIYLSNRIGNANTVTVPAMHNGKPVLVLEDFSAGTNLQTIIIPNSVQIITLGSTGYAFSGLTNLTTIEIIETEGSHEAKYFSKDGLLYTTGGGLVYVPLGYTGADGVATLPGETTSIVTGAFYQNSHITKVVIPGTVTTIGADAFNGCSELTAIEMKSAGGTTLAISDGAFNLSALTEITIPYYTEAFSAAKLGTTNNLQKVFVDGTPTGDGYLSVGDAEDGVLYRKTGTTITAVYCPVKNPMENYTVPAGVSVIGANAFQKATNIKTVTISVGVTEIQEYAFDGCTGIAGDNGITFSATADSSALTIGDYAFQSTKPTKLTIPANVTKVGFRALYTTTLNDVTLQGKAGMVVDYAMGAIYTDSKAAKLTLGANFPVIDIAGVFSSQSTTAKPSAAKLTEINISANSNYATISSGSDGHGGYYGKNAEGQIERLVYVMSADLSATENFKIPSGVKEIGACAFLGNTKVVSVEIPTSITEIHDYAFYGCTKITTITFDTLTEGTRQPLTLGKGIFHGCSLLEHLNVGEDTTTNTLPAETVEIGSFTFGDCPKLTSITIPGSVETITEYLFAGHSREAKPNETGNGCGIETITLSEGVQWIDTGAFYGCKNLTTINLPQSLEGLRGSDIFRRCDMLTTVNVNAGNKRYSTQDGILYENTQSGEEYVPVKLLFVPMSSNGTDGVVTIPSTVTEIAIQAFYSVNGTITIKTVNFADQVVATNDGAATLTIPEKAFYGLKTLESIHLPAGLTEIGKYAFYNCSKLATINIPYTVTLIDEYVFYGCTVLDMRKEGAKTGLSFDETPEEISDKAPLTLAKQSFYYTMGLTEIDLPERTTVIAAQAFDTNYGSNLAKVTLPSTLQSIGASAFKGNGAGNDALTTVILPEAFVSECVIDASAFEACTGLATIGNKQDVFVNGVKTEVSFLPEGLVSIGEKAFSGTAITTIGLPASLKTTAGGDNSSFLNCAELTTIAFANNSAMEELPGGFVKGTTALHDVVFAENMNIVTFGSDSKSVFEGSGQLSKLVIPNSVETIAQNAFQGLSGLQEVTFQDGSKLKEIETGAFSSCTGLVAITLPTVTGENGQTAEIVVGENVFQGCVTLNSVDLGASIWNIEGLFAGLAAIETIEAEGNDYFEIDNEQKIIYGLNAEGGRDTLLYIFHEITTPDVTIDEGTIAIAASAFKGQTGITSLELPSTLVRIDASAFEDCIHLQTVTFTATAGKVSALSKIGDGAFKNCWDLASFEFEKAFNLGYIGQEAFAYSGLTTADLSKCAMFGSSAAGSALKGIANSAFAYCTELGTEVIAYTADAAEEDQYSVILPSSLDTIGESAFSGDTALARIDMSKTKLTELAASLFKGCSALVKVNLPDGLETIGNSAFESAGLASITLPTSVKEIENFAFRSASNLASVNFEELTKLTTIGNQAFNGAGLQSVTLCASVNSLGPNVFQQCASLEEADLSACTNITTLGASFFQGCTALSDVTLPDSITTLEAGVFKDCESLTEIELPQSLTNLGSASANDNTYGVFEGTGLVSIDLSNTNVTKIGTGTFKNTADLTEVIFPEGLTNIVGYAFKGSGISTINLPEGYTEIDTRAFQGCTGLTTIDLTHVTKLNTYVFADCTNLTTIDLKDIGTIGNYVFQNAGLTSVTLGESLTTIPQYAFDGCKDLGSIDLTHVTTLNNYAFQNSGLTSVTLGTGITAIPSSAFNGCAGLTTIDLTHVTKLNANAFQNSGLQSVTMGTGITEIPNNAFNGCASLTTIDLTNVTSVGTSAFQNSGLTSVTMGTGLTTISNYAFAGCAELTAINLTNVTSIGTSAFEGAGLTNVTMGTGITTIPASAFAGCESLTTIDLSNVTTIGDGAFSGAGLTNVAVKTGVTYGKNVFEKTSVTAVTIDTGVTEIPEGMFAECEGLVTIDLQGVTTVGASAFEGCTSLATITAKNVTSVGIDAFKGCALVSENVTTTEGDGNLSIENNVLYRGTVAVAYLSGDKEATAVTTLKTGTTEIQTGAFTGYTAGGTLSIANTVQIDSYAFRGAAFDKIEIATSTTATIIQSYAFAESKIKVIEFTTTAGNTNTLKNATNLFENSTELMSVKLPYKSASTLGANMFAGCTSLKAVSLPTGTSTLTLDANFFKGCTSLASFEYSEEVASIANGKIELELPTNVGTVNGYAFDGTNIATLTIPNKVTKFANYALANMAALTTVNLNAKIASSGAGTYVFSGDNLLETVTFQADSGLQYIGDNWFRDCASLATVTLPTALVSIGSNAFRGCIALEQLILPSAVTSIGASAFNGCTALKYVEIPSGITSLNSNVFSGASEDLHVFIPRTTQITGKLSVGHYYFEATKYEMVVSQSIGWVDRANWSNYTFGATVAAAKQAAGITDAAAGTTGTEADNVG